MAEKWFWVSNPLFTVAVIVNDKGIIVDGPPRVRVFVGQPLTNLVGWKRGTTIIELNELNHAIAS